MMMMPMMLRDEHYRKLIMFDSPRHLPLGSDGLLTRVLC
jgi:hypothetical protein